MAKIIPLIARFLIRRTENLFTLFHISLITVGPVAISDWIARSAATIVPSRVYEKTCNRWAIERIIRTLSSWAKYQKPMNRDNNYIITNRRLPIIRLLWEKNIVIFNMSNNFQWLCRYSFHWKKFNGLHYNCIWYNHFLYIVLTTNYKRSLDKLYNL